MKKILCLILIISAVSVLFGKDNPFQKIVDLPGMNKKAIFDKSLQWISTSFKSGKAVTDYSDVQAGRIIANVITPATLSKLRSKLTIDIKDNKARLTFNPTTGLSYTGNEIPWISSDLPKAAEKLFKDYETYMKDPQNENKDW